MRKHCKGCGKNIPGRPIIMDDYYYCNKPDVPCFKGYRIDNTHTV